MKEKILLNGRNLNTHNYLIFLNQEGECLNYTLTTENPSIRICGNLDNPIAVDMDGGPMLNIGVIVENLKLISIRREDNEYIFAFQELNENEKKNDNKTEIEKA